MEELPVVVRVREYLVKSHDTRLNLMSALVAFVSPLAVLLPFHVLRLHLLGVGGAGSASWP